MVKKDATDLAVVKVELEYIKKALADGFNGVHKRQDTANGKLMKHEEKLSELDIKIVNVCDELKDKVSKEQYSTGVLNEIKNTSDLKSKVIYATIGGIWTVIVLVISHYIPTLFGG